MTKTVNKTQATEIYVAKIREAGKRSYEVFVKEVLGYEVARHHRRWINHRLSAKETMLLGPRSHGKSIIGTPSYALCKLVNNPDLRIAIASNTDPQAAIFTRQIKDIIEKHKMFRACYGDIVAPGSKWTETELYLRGRNPDEKEPNVYATGAFGAITNKHFDIVLIDDLVDEENSRTEHQRDLLLKWYRKTLRPCKTPTGEEHWLGTRYHPKDLYGERIEETAVSVEYQNAEPERATKKPFKSKSPTNVMKALIAQALKKNPNGTYTALWPEEWPVETLLHEKHVMGSVIFALQYQQNAELAKGHFFKEEWFKRMSEVDFNQLSNIRSAQGVDLAISKKETADFFGHGTVATDGVNFYILDTYKDKMSFAQQCALVTRKYTAHRDINAVRQICCSAVAYEAAMARHLSEFTTLPVKAVNVHRDKVSRCHVLAGHFEAGKVYFVGKHTDLEDELLMFDGSEGTHDDLIEAIDFAISYLWRGYEPQYLSIRGV